MKRWTPLKDAVDSCALVVPGSDWAVVPSANPWIAIETLVTRQEPGGGGETLGESQKITLKNVKNMLDKEEDLFESSHPKSKELYSKGLKHYLYGTPLHWMQQWPGLYPIYVEDAKGATIVDVDGNTYVDFALGDTGAMFGHANPATVEAISAQVRKGSTMMLPTEDSIWVGEELARRFGLPYWQVTTGGSYKNHRKIQSSMACNKDRGQGGISIPAQFSQERRRSPSRQKRLA